MLRSVILRRNSLATWFCSASIFFLVTSETIANQHFVQSTCKEIGEKYKRSELRNGTLIYKTTDGRLQMVENSINARKLSGDYVYFIRFDSRIADAAGGVISVKTGKDVGTGDSNSGQVTLKFDGRDIANRRVTSCRTNGNSLEQRLNSVKNKKVTFDQFQEFMVQSSGQSLFVEDDANSKKLLDDAQFAYRGHVSEKRDGCSRHTQEASNRRQQSLISDDTGATTFAANAVRAGIKTVSNLFGKYEKDKKRSWTYRLLAYDISSNQRKKLKDKGGFVCVAIRAPEIRHANILRVNDLEERERKAVRGESDYNQLHYGDREFLMGR